MHAEMSNEMIKTNRLIRALADNCQGNSVDEVNINDIETVYGRVCVGKSDQHFESLHWKGVQRKPISFVFSNDGLKYFMNAQAASSKTCIGALHALGLPDRKMHKKLEDGYMFRLGLFQSEDAVCADWDGIFQFVKSFYPTIYDKVLRYSIELMTLPFSVIEEQAMQGYLEGETYQNIHEYFGEKDNRYMTLARLEKRSASLPEVYGWLIHYVGINSLFSGDGYTKLTDGSNGCKEFIVKNDKVDNLKGFRWVDLSLDLDDLS